MSSSFKMYVDDDMLDQLTEEDHYTYASIIPLIGGETIAMQNAFGKRPEYIMSYEAFTANDSQLLNYYNNEVPYQLLDNFTGYLKEVDVVNSVCPCAGLSMLNVNASSDSATNDWMIESAKYVLGKVKPKVFWGENAPGLYGNMGKPVVERLREVGNKYGYTLSLYKTKSTLHGLGQVRNRAFYFFWKDSRVPVLPYFNREKEPIEECIRNAYVSDDDPMNELVNERKPSDDPWYKYILEEVEGGITHKEFFERIEGSTNPLSYIEHKKISYLDVAKWFKEHGYEKQADKCIRIDKKYKDGGSIMKRGVELGKGHTSAFVGHFATSLTHPDEDRFISIREALSIMKMPKDFNLQGGKKNLNMICQNVPVSTAQDMAQCVKDYLDRKLDTVNSKFMRQSNINRTHEVENNSLEEFLV
jgi:site-specific DNA-cytosine methylase